MKRRPTLTPEDITAIAEAVREQMTEGFYNDLGRGIWGFVKRAFISLIIGVAAYGLYTEMKPEVVQVLPKIKLPL